MFKKKNIEIHDDGFCKTGNFFAYTFASIKDKNILLDDVIDLIRETMIKSEYNDLLKLLLSLMKNPFYKAKTGSF